MSRLTAQEAARVDLDAVLEGRQKQQLPGHGTSGALASPQHLCAQTGASRAFRAFGHGICPASVRSDGRQPSFPGLHLSGDAGSEMLDPASVRSDGRQPSFPSVLCRVCV